MRPLTPRRGAALPRRSDAGAPALARLLADFGAPARAADIVGQNDAQPPETMEEALARARREGEADALARAEAEWTARLAEQEDRARARSLAEIARARALWAQAEGEALAARLESAFGALRAEVEEGVAAALRPLAGADAAREAARAMAQEIASLLAAGAGEGAPVEIVGPPDLLAALRAALDADPRVGPTAARLSFVEAEGVDAFARLGRAVVETRLEALARALDALD